MTPYLIAHFKISAFFMLLVLFLAKSKRMSNKLHLILFYLILIKIILPWGIIGGGNQLSFGSVGGGVSFDLPADFGLAANECVTPILAHDHLLFFAWAVVAALILLFCLAGLFRLGTSVKKARRCDDPTVTELMAAPLPGSIKRMGVIDVLVSDMIATPFVWWNRRWSIVLPESMLALSRMEKKVILAHELAHIRRKDFVKFLFLKGIKSLFFFSPLVLFIINEIVSREETETDLEAMRLFGIAPDSFGNTLLNVLCGSNPAAYPVPTLIQSTRRRRKMRIEGLFQKKPTPKTIWVRTVLTSMVIVTMMFNFTSSTAAKNSISDGDFMNPLASSRLTLGFGAKTHPITNKPYQHNGIDLAALLGSDVMSSADGTVIEADYDDNRGNFLLLQHDNGYTTLYSHLSEILVSKGSNVKRGEKIATVGNSGLSTGPHLHFEISKNNQAVDPLGIITLKTD
jgi:beta-lactamase regulating signal transducer with metallopeptidase domain